MSQQFGVKLDELTSSTPGVVLYGVTPDNKVIPIKISDTGSLLPTISKELGSTNSFFADSTTIKVNSDSWQHLEFGFNSTSITVVNDEPDGTFFESLLVSFTTGDTIHLKVKTGERVTMPCRQQAGLWIKGLAAESHKVAPSLELAYRVWAY